MDVASAWELYGPAPAPVGLYAAVRVGESPGCGRGVFATAALPAGALLEVAPVIVCPEGQTAALEATTLFDYRFLWGPDERERAVCLGYGSLYNHSEEPNAAFRMHFAERTISFHALRAVAAGEELRVNYHGFPEQRGPLWFDPA